MVHTIKLKATVEIEVEVEAESEEQAKAIVQCFPINFCTECHETEVKGYWLGEDYIQPAEPITLEYAFVDLQVMESEVMETTLA